jgi:hypothetical protein
MRTRSVAHSSARNFGAENGIRTRDPHLGKVVFSVSAAGSGSPSPASVHPASIASIQCAPVVERSNITQVPPNVHNSSLE